MDAVQTWHAVDQYIEHVVGTADEALTAALVASGAAGLPAINVSPVHRRESC